MQFFQPQRADHLLQPLRRAFARQVFVLRDDQLVLHRMLPADKLRHAYLIAVGLKLQAAQHVGDLAAEFTRVQRVAPDFRERIAERLALVLA
eukprot:11336-Eustigmatos_ZCMA.PRE.1